MKRKKARNRRTSLRDIGQRWCTTCIRATVFRWSPSQNAYVCEQCEYEKVMSVDINLLKSEAEFIKLLESLERNPRV